MKNCFFLLCFCVNYILSGGCSDEPMTAEDIVAKSYNRHGGKALSDWETMVIKGEVFKAWGQDTMHGEYLSYSQKPGKIRFEKDFTKFSHSPVFYTDIYNQGESWRMLNLNTYSNNLIGRLAKRQFDGCDGIAFYRAHADTLIMHPEGLATYVLDGDTVQTPAYIITTVIGEDSTTLYFDKKSYFLIQEEFKMAPVSPFRRVYTDFKRFGRVVLAERRIEFEPGSMGSSGVRYFIKSVEYNVPVDSALFEEFRPE